MSEGFRRPTTPWLRRRRCNSLRASKQRWAVELIRPNVWHKARQYALPLVLDGCKVVAHAVLWLRIPGGIAEVGLWQQRKSGLTQKDEEGNALRLESNWALFSAREHEEDILKQLGITRQDAKDHGLIRTIRHKGPIKLTTITENVRKHSIRIDTQLQKRRDRKLMQEDADKGHKGSNRGRMSEATELSS